MQSLYCEKLKHLQEHRIYTHIVSHFEKVILVFYSSDESSGYIFIIAFAVECAVVDFPTSAVAVVMYMKINSTNN